MYHNLAVGGKFTISKFKQRAIKTFHESNMQKLHKILNEYVALLSQTGVILPFFTLLFLLKLHKALQLK